MRYIHFKEIDSTNSYIKREYQNLDNLTFVSSSFQTNGHGRFNRVWNADNEESILFSYLLKDKKYLDNFSYISMFTAVLVCKYLENKGIPNVSIKWPNDVYINGKKVCGILLEGSLPEYIVVGVGINLNQKTFENYDLIHLATSISMELLDNSLSIEEERISIISLIHSFWESFKCEWNIFDDYLRSHNYLQGKKVRVTNTLQNIEGTVVGIDAKCNLLIKTNERIELINSGEIELI